MKNIIAILVLFSAVFASAQSGPSVAKSAPQEHRGFYANASVAFAYNWYNYSKEDNYNNFNYYNRGLTKGRDIDFFEYDGFTFPLTEFKFGVAAWNLVAFHMVFNVGFISGSLDYRNERYQSDCDVDGACVETRQEHEEEDPISAADAYSFRTYAGFGATFYPIQDKASPLNGLFVGASVGYMVFGTFSNVHGQNSFGNGGIGNGGIGFEFELGKEWWMSDHMSVGFGLGFAHSSLIWETVESHKSDNVISLSFRMTRG